MNQDLPENVQWLLDYANLGCVPGEPNPQRYQSYHTQATNEHIPKLKRPPIDLVPPVKKKIIPRENIGFRLPLHKKLERMKPGMPYLITDDGYVVSKVQSGAVVFHGKRDFHPPLEELRAFLKRRLPQDIVSVVDKKLVDNTWDDCYPSLQKSWEMYEKTGENISECDLCERRQSFKKNTACEREISGLLHSDWKVIHTVFYRVMQENCREKIHPFVKEVFDYARGSKPLNVLSERIRAYAWDFWDNHRPLHSRLKQCSCCGSFWIAGDVKRGRVQKYCSEECESRFNYQSKASDICSKKRYRQVRKACVREGIIKWLKGNHYEQLKNGAYRLIDQTRAEEIYDELPEKAKTSMREFERIWRKPRWY